MLCAIDLTANRETRAALDPGLKAGPTVVAGMLKRGVIARAMPQGDIIGLAPPMCLTKSEADVIVSSVKEALEEVFSA